MTSTMSGAVLVGGRSLRMGRDKARLKAGGAALWRRQLAVLRKAGARPAVLVLRRRQRSFGWRGGELRDVAPGAGPLGGLAAALLAGDAPWVAVLAVDLPRIDDAWFGRLRRACRRGCGAVARGPRGYEPLAAIYPAEAAEVCLDRLRRGRLSLQGLLEDLVRSGRMKPLTMRAADLAKTANWNTPADMESSG